MDNKNIIIDTDSKKEHGTNRCPKCGASDVTYNIKKGKLVCNYCYTEFDSHDVDGVEKEAKNLKGEKRTSGVKDIKAGKDIITLKCSGCGAEVVINTSESMNARCHWCRSILSINSQIENGSVPDFVLPFKLEKSDAQKNIDEFVKKRQFFANPIFKKEFTSENVMGVYFPYLLVDANCHASFAGKGGHVARSYSIVVGKDKDGNEKKETVYDIDVHHVERSFDIAIDDLSIESSKDKLDKSNKEKTTNVINAIMPFDTENCIKFESNYLVGYTSEKRDVNVDELSDKVDQSLLDIARYSINSDLTYYDSGVSWDDEKLDIIGKQWSSSYLPVWLYSYQDQKKILHYVAVNGRTGETMGSIPINKIKLTITSILLFIISFLLPILMLMFLKKLDIKNLPPVILFICLIISLIISLGFYFSKNSKYRNKGVRHKYEVETKNEVSNIKRKDNLVETLTRQSFSTLTGANNHRVVGEYMELKKDVDDEKGE